MRTGFLNITEPHKKSLFWMMRKHMSFSFLDFSYLSSFLILNFYSIRLDMNALRITKMACFLNSFFGAFPLKNDICLRITFCNEGGRSLGVLAFRDESTFLQRIQIEGDSTSFCVTVTTFHVYLCSGLGITPQKIEKFQLTASQGVTHSGGLTEYELRGRETVLPHGVRSFQVIDGYTVGQVKHGKNQSHAEYLRFRTRGDCAHKPRLIDAQVVVHALPS